MVIGNRKRWARRIMVAAGAFGVIATAAHATSITYTMSGVANGSLGPTDFTDAAFAVTVVADTGTVNSLGAGVPCNDRKSATFSIGGLGSGAITTPVSVAANSRWQLVTVTRGRCADVGPMWTNGMNPQLITYDLTRDIGPVPLEMPGAPPGIAVDTSAGQLAFRSVEGLTFQAQVGDPTTVPTLSETGLSLLTIMLAGTGAIAATRRRPG